MLDDNTMKVLFISASDYKYGAPKSMMELMISLRKYGVEPYLLTKKRNPLNQECERLGIPNCSFWYADIMAGAPYKNFFMRALKHCVKYALYCVGKLKKSNYATIPFNEIDLIHTNLNRIGIGAEIAEINNIPHIWHIRELGQEDYNLVFYKRNCIDYMNTHAHAFIVISEAVKKAWVKKGIDEKKMHVIYNCLNLDKFVPKRVRNDKMLKIVMTGHIQPNKGQLQLIKALEYIPESVRKNIRIDIYGEGYKEYMKVITKEIERLNCEDKVAFKGYSNNIPEVLKDYDIGIVASKAEGFGRITVEYMAAQLLVIASDTGANKEIIEDQYSGLIYKYNNSKDLAEKLIWAYENKELREEYAQRGYESAHSRFSYTSDITKKVYELYLQVLENVI